MEKAISKSIVIITAVILSSKVTFAYISPGLGSAIIGSLWPLIVAILMVVGAFFVKYFWKPIKKGYSKIFRKSS